MNDWLHDLPILWMAMLFFGGTYVVTAVIYLAVIALATGERARAFKSASPGMLPPLGILFALFVAFTAQQIWGDTDRAYAALGREASALRAAVVLATGWPGEPRARLSTLIRRYITEAVSVEWPMMAKKTAVLSVIPRDLSDALELTLSLTPSNQGQQIAQREIATELNAALAARDERIIISRAQVNPLKWFALLAQAACALLAIAFVHCDNRLSAALMMGLFATGIATSLLLIAAHDRPFIGELKVRPDPLLQVMPEASRSLAAAPLVG